MPKLDLDSIESTNRTGYPPPYDSPMAKRHYRRIAPAAGIEDFGISHVVLEPGGISSQRHWMRPDDVVIRLEGEALWSRTRGTIRHAPRDPPLSQGCRQLPSLVNARMRLASSLLSAARGERLPLSDVDSSRPPDRNFTARTAGHNPLRSSERSRRGSR